MQWWLWLPLVVGAWWYADRSWTWAWVVPIEAGIIGVQWSYLGVYAIAYWPGHLLLVGAGWIAYPLILASVSLYARSTSGSHGHTYQGY